jgi:hypothetical protein
MAEKKVLPIVQKKQSGCGCGCMAAPKDAKAIKPGTKKPKK